jgi:hypothetical protein
VDLRSESGLRSWTFFISKGWASFLFVAFIDYIALLACELTLLPPVFLLTDGRCAYYTRDSGAGSRYFLRPTHDRRTRNQIFSRQTRPRINSAATRTRKPSFLAWLFVSRHFLQSRPLNNGYRSGYFRAPYR